MIKALLYRVTADLPCRFINQPTGPYLERYYLGQLFGWTFYLHRFVSADGERDVHNHPWRRGFSVILAGGYREEVVSDLSTHGCVTFERVVRWFNRIDGAHFHRIAAAEPDTWTLFAHGPRQRINLGGASVEKGWGFLERVGARVVFAPWLLPSGEWWKTALNRRGGETRRSKRRGG